MSSIAPGSYLYGIRIVDRYLGSCGSMERDLRLNNPFSRFIYSSLLKSMRFFFDISDILLTTSFNFG